MDFRGLWSVNLDEAVLLALLIPKVTRKCSILAKVAVVKVKVLVKALANVVGKASVLNVLFVFFYFFIYYSDFVHSREVNWPVH